MPNGWISRQSDPKLDAGSSQLAPQSTTYTYDPAGHQTARTVEGQTMSGPSDRTLSSTYWPDGHLYDRVATGPMMGHREDRYYYQPTGERTYAQAQLGDGGSESAHLLYDSVGRLLSTNDATNGMSGSGGGKISPFDTVQAYDMDGSVKRRQANGSIYPTAAGSPVMYKGGQTTTFGYDNLDRETGMSVAPNPDAASSDPLSCPNANGQPCRSFTSAYFPSGQVQTRTRSQDGGQPITEDYAYNDDGSLRSDQRIGGDAKNVSYSYDLNANRTADERGTHAFNALNQEVHWTRGPDTQNPGSTVDYRLDGTGGMLQQKSHTMQSSTAPDGTPVTAVSDSTTDFCSQATAMAAQTNISACQHDSDRVESAYRSQHDDREGRAA